MAEETVDLQRLVVSLEARLKTFDKQMEKLKGQTDKNLAGVEKRFQKAETAISGFGKRTQASLSSLGGNLFAGLNPAALVASLSGAGIAAFAKTAITNLGNIKDQAEQAGVSIREMQELTFAAVSEGFGASDIVGIFQKLNKEIADARVNGGQLADILKANNVPLTDQNGVLRSNKDLFLDIVDLIKNAKNAADAQLISQLAMGRSAGELAPLFKLGAAGLREMFVEAERVAFVVGDDMVKAADRFADHWNTFLETSGKRGSAWFGERLQELETLARVAKGDTLVKGSIFSLGRDQQFASPTDEAVMDARKRLAGLRKARSFYDKNLLDGGGAENVRRTIADIDAKIAAAEELLRIHREINDEVRPPVGPTVKPTIVPIDADKKAEDAAEKTRETARQKAKADKEALAKATETLFVATQREIALKELEAQAQGRSVYEMERARKEMELMARLEDEHRQYGGAVTDEELANVRLLADAWGNVNQEMAENQQALSELQEVGDTVFGGLEDAIDKFIDTGKLDVKAMVASIVKDLAKLSIHNLLGAIQNGSGGSGSGGVMGWLGSLLPSGRSKAPSQQGSAVPAIIKAFEPGAGLSAGTPLGKAPSQQGSAVPAIIKAFEPGAGLSAGTPLGKMPGGMSGVKGQVWNYFAAKGLAPHQIAGIMGNVQAESAFNPNAVGDGGDAFGLFQWNNRRPALFKHAGTNTPNVQQQLDFAWHELQTSERGSLKRLMGSKDVFSATKAFAGFERPKGFSFDNPQAMAGWQERITAAQQMMAQSSKGLSASLSKVTAAASTSATDFSGAFGPALQSVVGAVGGGKGGGGGFLSFLPQLLSLIPGLAKGGPVRKGQPYIVGDGGEPEFFVPDQNGRIMPQVPRLATPRPAMAAIPNYGGRQQVDVNIRADASPFLLLETDARSARIARAGDGRTLRSAERQAPQRMAQFEKLGT